ncbi:hypothetical protein [Bacillus piscicola]|uniref:hypothetical protein n=1 Tax=Bacillus piscicola TaxID=1632684 RepID=UPI001F08B67A|nr:hypothetical protein [Bacillus piscicola]
MGKEINQNNALNQVALINSKGNQVNIVNNPIEYISMLIEQGKFEEAVGILKEVTDQVEKLHPLYPHYSFTPVNIGSKIAFEHRPASKEVAKKYPLHFKGSFSITEGQATEGETFEDLVTRKYFSQEKISIDMKYIETWIGDELINNEFSLEHHAVEEGEWFIVPEKLPFSIKAKLVLVEEIERVLVDYLELSITEVDNKRNRMVISNIRQENSPVVLSLIMPNIFVHDSPTEEEKIKFNIRVRESFERNVRAEKVFLEFLKYARKCSEMRLIALETQNIFFSSKNVRLDDSQDIQGLNERLLLLSELTRIEDEFDIRFQLPDIMGDEDYEKIEVLKAVINKKEITSKIENFSTNFDDKDTVQKFINDVEDKPLMITANENKVFELFGVPFKNIEAKHTFENLVVKNPERIKKKLEYFDEGDTIKVELKPGTKNYLVTLYSVKT